MKSIRFFLPIALLLFMGVESFSQVTSIPQAAKDNFAQQYPGAQNVKWDNDVVNVNVRFNLNSEKMNAEYNNKGIWKNTYQDFAYDRLPDAVRDGFKKSKYSERTVNEVKKVYYPGNVEQYRIKAEKSGVEKKYLFFNTEGRLVRDVITL